MTVADIEYFPSPFLLLHLIGEERYQALDLSWNQLVVIDEF